MTESERQEVLKSLHGMGMEGASAEEFFGKLAMQDIIDLVKKISGGDPDSNEAMLNFVASIYLKGRISAYQGDTPMEAGALMVAVGANILDPSEKMVAVGITPGGMLHMLNEDEPKIFKTGAKNPAGDGKDTQVIVLVGRSRDELVAKLLASREAAKTAEWSQTIH